MRATLKNFGCNLKWTADCRRPQDEKEVLAILRERAHVHIRAFGGQHSWSDGAVCEDISLDMGMLKDVQPYEDHGRKLVRVGAGCTLQELLNELHKRTDQTLPTVGVIKKQTISGAISTGTHGSGRQSLSHFVTGIRVAAYDQNGEPRIYEYKDGDELRAARCALGCMGIILSVDLATVPKYYVRETVHIDAQLDTVLPRFKEGGALTQFSLIPYIWKFITFERSRSPATVSPWQKLVALLMRLHTLVVVDLGVHLGVWLGAAFTARVHAGLGGWFTRKILLRIAPCLFVRGARRIDHAEHVLTQKHDLFKHEEMELFVPESRLAEVVAVLRCATEVFAGTKAPVPDDMAQKLRTLGLYDALLAKKGSYTHHYGFFFRRVLPDENTLVSMTSSTNEAYFSIGVFTYFCASVREPYYEFCCWLARCLYSLVGARLHWGKHFPLPAHQVTSLYPAMQTFKKLCGETDRNGVFRNAYTGRVLGLALSAPATAFAGDAQFACAAQLKAS